MLSEKEKLDKLTFLGIELNQVRDLDILMERVLEDARHFVNADAGSIYIKDKDEDTLQFTYTQNDTLQQRLPKGEKLIYSTFTLPINKESIAGYVATTGELLNIPDVYKLEPATPDSIESNLTAGDGPDARPRRTRMTRGMAAEPRS